LEFWRQSRVCSLPRRRGRGGRTEDRAFAADAARRALGQGQADDGGRRQEEGVDLRVQVTDNDAAKQVAQCENLLSQGIKVLILAPHDASSASVIIDKADKAGVKVISYDRW